MLWDWWLSRERFLSFWKPSRRPTTKQQKLPISQWYLWTRRFIRDSSQKKGISSKTLLLVLSSMAKLSATLRTNRNLIFTLCLNKLLKDVAYPHTTMWLSMTPPWNQTQSRRWPMISLTSTSIGQGLLRCPLHACTLTKSLSCSWISQREPRREMTKKVSKMARRE